MPLIFLCTLPLLHAVLGGTAQAKVHKVKRY
jgi:hypothetical protein